jgi:hypothetical protein
VTADRVRADLVGRSAVLLGRPGRPARVVEGNNLFECRRVKLRELRDDDEPNAPARYTVFGEGPGGLEFLTREDFNGRTLAEPRPIRVAWREGMSYRSGTRQVAFRGQVKLRSGPDRMRCGRMRLHFEQGGAAEASRPTAPARRRAIAVGLEDYSAQKLAMIVADGNVEALSNRLRADGHLLRQLKLTTPRLVYDASKDEMNAFNRGTLMLADYRPPARRPARPRRPRPLSADNVRTPYQAVFRWDKLMSLHTASGPDPNDEPNVVLKGNVAAVFFSGRYVVLADRLNTPPWPEDMGGRKTRLRCERLAATFRRAADANRPGGGPRVGTLKHFNAQGGVNLVDGDRVRWQAVCESLDYDQKADRLILLGYLPGEPRKMATLRREDFRTMPPKVDPPVSAEGIIWVRQNERQREHITVFDVSGAGGR